MSNLLLLACCARLAGSHASARPTGGNAYGIVETSNGIDNSNVGGAPLSDFWLGVVFSMGGVFQGLPARLGPLAVRAGGPRCPTHYPDPLWPIFDPPAIVTINYMWSICSTLHVLLFTFINQYGNNAGVLMWVPHRELSAPQFFGEISDWELSSPPKGFLSGFPGWHHFPFGNPWPKYPTLISDHYYAHPPLYRIRGWCHTPPMGFCLHSVTDIDEGLEFSRVSYFGAGVVLAMEGFSHRVFPDDITSGSEPPGQSAPPSALTPSNHYWSRQPLYLIYTNDWPIRLLECHTHTHVQTAFVIW